MLDKRSASHVHPESGGAAKKGVLNSTSSCLRHNDSMVTVTAFAGRIVRRVHRRSPFLKSRFLVFVVASAAKPLRWFGRMFATSRQRMIRRQPPKWREDQIRRGPPPTWRPLSTPWVRIPFCLALKNRPLFRSRADERPTTIGLLQQSRCS